MAWPRGKWLYPWGLGIQVYLELVLAPLPALVYSGVRKKTHGVSFFTRGLPSIFFSVHTFP